MRPVLEIRTPDGFGLWPVAGTSTTCSRPAGLRVTGGAVTFAPGCCDGLGEWRDWCRPADHDGLLGFGHDPVTAALARALGLGPRNPET